MAWYVVRYTIDKLNTNETNRFYLILGDIVKFGRVRFRIRKLVLHPEDESEEENDEDQ